MNRTAALTAVPVVAAATLLLAGCNGGTTPAAKSSAATSSAPARRAGAGLVGPITSVAAGSFVLRARAGTATVDYSDRTQFARTAEGALANVTPGVCVAVVEAPGSDPSTGSVDASSVTVRAPVGGACTGGAGGAFRGGGGAFPSGGAGRFRGGAGGSGGRGAGLVAGSVASVSGSGFDVTVTTPASSGGSAATTTMAVAVSPSTRYTVMSAAAASDLAVGECARVFAGGARRAGSSAPTAPAAPASGPVTAVTVTLSAPANGGCTVGTRNGGGGGGA